MAAKTIKNTSNVKLRPREDDPGAYLVVGHGDRFMVVDEETWELGDRKQPKRTRWRVIDGLLPQRRNTIGAAPSREEAIQIVVRYLTGETNEERKQKKKNEKARSDERFAEVKAKMWRRGYVSNGHLPSGGEYRWTITFPSAALAMGFHAAVTSPRFAGDLTRSATVNGRTVYLVSTPGYWPGRLYRDELATFGGQHDYRND